MCARKEAGLSIRHAIDCTCTDTHARDARTRTHRALTFISQSQVKEGSRRLEELLESRNQQRSTQQQSALSANLVPGLQQEVVRKDAEIQQLSDRTRELEEQLSSAQTMAEYFSSQLLGDRAACDQQVQAHVAQLALTLNPRA